jgi:uncharacterized membrane protein YciS (DUF1049 family)
MATLTNDQWIIIAIIFAAGLIIGLILRSGGANWRMKYEAERNAHTQLRRDHDALLTHHEALPVERDRLRSGSF